MSPEPLDPEKFHRFDMLSKKTKTYIAIAVTFLFVLLPIMLLGYYKFAVNRPAQSFKAVTVEIKKGQGVSEIASNLERAGAVNSEFLFKLYVALNNLQRNLQAGTYEIPAGTSIATLTQMLQLGLNDRTVTFIEGWRVEEFAYRASTQLENIDYTKLVMIAKPYEGYLFPDTYLFNAEIQEEQLLDILMKNFEKKTSNILTQDNLDKAGLTLEQTMIFASILEREIYKDEDMPIVAGILIKRWNEGMKIDADATTQYAVIAQRYGCTELIEETQDVCPNVEDIGEINWWPNNLTVTELESTNPYNTRGVVGLPPTPIANPGLKAIEAVINHVPSEYYYYLTDKDDTTHYARTLQEHNQNVQRFLNN
jgi:UPF0755 protein